MSTTTGDCDTTYGQQLENNSREVRGEGGESRLPPVSRSKGRTSETSSEFPSQLERIHGETGSWRVLSPAFFGGILSLEKEKATEALRNAEECLQWYAREKDRALGWIAKIDALQAELEGKITSDQETE